MSEQQQQKPPWRFFKRCDFFGDVVDTPKEGTKQHKKQECQECHRHGQGAFMKG